MRTLHNALLVVLVSLSAAAAAVADTPAWIQARTGAAAFIDNDGEDAPTGVVCPSIKLYRRYVKTNEPAGCTQPHQGRPVVMDAITPVSDNMTRAIVKLHALDGSFSGYTALTMLKTVIPRGLDVVLKPAASEKLTVATSQHIDLDSGVNLGWSAEAIVIRYDPSINDGRDLQVRIISGKYAGTVGWLYARQAYLRDGSEIDVFKS